MSLHRYSPLIPLLLLCLIPTAGSGGPSPPAPGSPAFPRAVKIPNPWPDPGDTFGGSVALTPNMLAVGAPREDAAGIDAGAVHLFQHGRLVASLMPEDLAADASFGWALAIDGKQMLVGAPGAAGGGAVYVYARNGSVWQRTARLRPADPDADGRFGQAVALDRDRIVVGAPFERSGCAYCGAVYVFTRSPVGWVEEARLTAPSLPSAALLGAGVAVEGDLVAAGAPYLGMGFVKGQAHLFGRTPAGWVHLQRLPCSLCGGRDRFGAGLRISRGRVVVGAPRDAPPPFGFHAVFEPYNDPVTGETVWEEVQTDVSPEPEAFDRFGAALAVDHHMLLVGAPEAGDTGAAFLYRSRGSGWEPLRDLSPATLGYGEQFGASVALCGNRAAVGAPQDLMGGAGPGSVYLFGNVQGGGWLPHPRTGGGPGRPSRARLLR